VIRARHVLVHSNAGHAAIITNCELSVDSSTFRDNGTGIFISASLFEIVNNFILRNGSPGALYAAVHIEDNDTEGIRPGRFEFNTLAQNQALNSWGVHCAATDQTMSNNIVVSTVDDDAAVSGSCAWTYSNIQREAGTVEEGAGNMNVPALFVDPNEDFHLRTGSPCVDGGDPAALLEAPLPVDFDGDPRPAGGAPDIGADESN